MRLLINEIVAKQVKLNTSSGNKNALENEFKIKAGKIAARMELFFKISIKLFSEAAYRRHWNFV